jgi:hypothetical protein
LTKKVVGVLCVFSCAASDKIAGVKRCGLRGTYTTRSVAALTLEDPRIASMNCSSSLHDGAGETHHRPSSPDAVVSCWAEQAWLRHAQRLPHHRTRSSRKAGRGFQTCTPTQFGRCRSEKPPIADRARSSFFRHWALARPAEHPGGDRYQQHRQVSISVMTAALEGRTLRSGAAHRPA